jgi:hypothetical protein
MKSSCLALSAASLTSLAFFVHTAGADIVLSEVYSGGGSSSATAAYHTDFVELENTGSTPVDITGFTLAYGSSAQPAGSFSTAIGTLSGTIAPGGFFLVETGSAGTGGAADVTPDVLFRLGASLSATSGAVRLAGSDGTVLDVLGYGSTNNFETTAATAPANIGLSLNRTNGVDTNNNSADFTSATPSPMATIPEPSSCAMLGFSVVGLLSMQRMRRRLG